MIPLPGLGHALGGAPRARKASKAYACEAGSRAPRKLPPGSRLRQGWQAPGKAELHRDRKTALRACGPGEAPRLVRVAWDPLGVAWA